MLVIVSRLNRIIVILKVCACTVTFPVFYVVYVLLNLFTVALGGPDCNIRDNGSSRFYRV